jgi:chemotaxis protein CheC
MQVSEEILDGVRELITIGVGRSAGMLNRLSNAHVTLTVPEVQILDEPTWNEACPLNTFSEHEQTSQIILQFSGELTGSFRLVIPYESALNMVMILTGEESSPDEMDMLRVETLLEVGNVIISSVMSSLSILLSSHLSFQFPIYRTDRWFGADPGCESGVIIVAGTRFEVQQKAIVGEMIILLTKESYTRLCEGIRLIMEEGL